MLGPIARWALKKAVSGTEKAVRGSIRASEERQRKAEMKQEAAREAADPAYRAYKETLREQERIAAETRRIAREVQQRKEDRLQRNRKLSFKASEVMYLICISYCLYLSSQVRGRAVQADWLLHDFVANILASVWILAVVLFAVSDFMNVADGSGNGLGCGVVILIPLCWLGYVFLVICSRGGF